MKESDSISKLSDEASYQAELGSRSIVVSNVAKLRFDDLRNMSIFKGWRGREIFKISFDYAY